MSPVFSIRLFRAYLFLFLGLLLTAQTGLHAQSTRRGAVAGERSDSQPSFAVRQEGRGKPMIFIPGLESSGEVWAGAVKHFSGRFTCYTLTLPGFAGQAPIHSDSILATVVYQLATYIRQHHLSRPVIVGHSLGGWIALDFAVSYPDLAGDLVIVSSAPFLPALSMGPGITADSAGKIGLIIKKAMQGVSAEQVKITQSSMLASMIRDSARIAEVADMASRSDQATQGEIMYELFSSDLRPLMNRVTSRILALGDWSSYKAYGATRENVIGSLREQYKLAKQVTIAVNDSSRHFIMFDEPEWMYAQMDGWLIK